MIDWMIDCIKKASEFFKALGELAIEIALFVTTLQSAISWIRKHKKK